ncbi:ABC transporter ATP-binding protein [Thermus thermophilus]|uniref:GNAT family N-acetyltransferase n=1 Tax=Thermus thermophilus TaxID=274 RepID=UPI0011654207|nr:GNAT family N-acetyltransferase [Thermus thermophilus]BBL92745.1 ABC transporter ATP-binding protein [Thermus thermophilus]
MRVLGRRIYWRWYGEVLLEGGVTLRMTGDVAKWLRPGDRVRLRTEFKKPVLGFDEYALEAAFPLWPPFAKTLEHVRESPFGGEAYRYRLKVREATYEGDYEAIAELEQFHYASEKEVVALWVCTQCQKTLPANARPLCDCGGEARLKEIRGSTPASRFLVLELAERLPFEPRILGYLRLDPPIPRMHRRTPEGVERDIRERIFPRDWFHSTYEGGADWQRALDRVNTAAARIARVVVHPDYRSEGFGALLVRVALEWAKERGAPEARREKHLVYTIAQMARYHPFFEKVGFRYLFDTASGRPVLFYPLTEEAEGYLERFLREDPYAQEHGGRLFRPRFGRVEGLKGPIRLEGVHKGYRSHLELKGLSPEVRGALEAFGVKARVVERAVLRGASLEIPPGSLVVLAGASGAGKTTLLRLLLGEAPDAGEVAVPPGRRVAYIPGEREVDLGEAPILEAVYRRLKDVGAAIEVLNRVGLSDAVLYRARPHELSTGQRERFRLALLLAERPDLLLIDEFAAHLDVPTARRVALGLGKLCREAGVTLVAATHRPEVVAALDPDLLVYVGYGGLTTVPRRGPRT